MMPTGSHQPVAAASSLRASGFQDPANILQYAQVLNLLFTNSLPLYHVYIPYSVLPSFPRATSSRVYTQWHMAQSLKPSLWPLVTGIYPIPSAGSVYDDLVLFLHAFTPLITFGLICNSFHFACFVNSSLRFLIICIRFVHAVACSLR